MIPKDPRNRWYFVIVMPLNAGGHGPADTQYESTTLTWEVWDQEMTVHASYGVLPSAIQKCEELNEAYYADRT